MSAAVYGVAAGYFLQSDFKVIGLKWQSNQLYSHLLTIIG